MKIFFTTGDSSSLTNIKRFILLQRLFLLFWERVKTLILRAPAKGKLAKMDNKR